MSYFLTSALFIFFSLLTKAQEERSGVHFFLWRDAKVCVYLEPHASHHNKHTAFLGAFPVCLLWCEEIPKYYGIK